MYWFNILLTPPHALSVWVNIEYHIYNATPNFKIRPSDSTKFSAFTNISMIHLMSTYSYMDTEQYDEAVRDYEKICNLDKTKGG